MQLFEKINEKLGFTEMERKVVWFLVLMFALGAIVKFTKLDSVENTTEIKYNQTSTPVFPKSNRVSEKININTATELELVKIPGIGRKTAKKIVEYRKVYGKFIYPEDIMNVPGIGRKKFERIKKYITVK